MCTNAYMRCEQWAIASDTKAGKQEVVRKPDEKEGRVSILQDLQHLKLEAIIDVKEYARFCDSAAK